MTFPSFSRQKTQPAPPSSTSDVLSLVLQHTQQPNLPGLELGESTSSRVLFTGGHDKTIQTWDTKVLFKN